MESWTGCLMLNHIFNESIKLIYLAQTSISISQFHFAQSRLAPANFPISSPLAPASQATLTRLSAVSLNGARLTTKGTLL